MNQHCQAAEKERGGCLSVVALCVCVYITSGGGGGECSGDKRQSRWDMFIYQDERLSREREREKRRSLVTKSSVSQFPPAALCYSLSSSSSSVKIVKEREKRVGQIVRKRRQLNAYMKVTYFDWISSDLFFKTRRRGTTTREWLTDWLTDGTGNKKNLGKSNRS